MPSQPIRLARAESAADLVHLANLFRAYEAEMGLDLCFQSFDEEIRSLPGKYAPPHGEVLLALNQNRVAVACGAFRPFDHDVCELKRLYVHPEMRGKGLGEALIQELMVRAKSVGYKAMCLDTLTTMRAAFALYRKLGFEECPPYYPNPLPGVVYMSKLLY